VRGGTTAPAVRDHQIVDLADRRKDRFEIFRKIRPDAAEPSYCS